MTYAAWDGYRTAVLVIDTPTEALRVEPGPLGTTEGRFPFNETIHIITAFNPGIQLSDSENALRHRELGSLLDERGARFFTARGADPEWSHVEASFAVLGLARTDAVALGRQFGQDAIFEWTPRAWAIVGCDEERVERSGWSCRAVPG